jgi:hypothetical protein
MLEGRVGRLNAVSGVAWKVRLLRVCDFPRVMTSTEATTVNFVNKDIKIHFKITICFSLKKKREYLLYLNNIEFLINIG